MISIIFSNMFTTLDMLYLYYKICYLSDLASSLLVARDLDNHPMIKDTMKNIGQTIK